MTNERYEYKKVSVSDITQRFGEMNLNKLNALGAEGWDMITIVSGEVIFKRPIGWGMRVNNENRRI